MIRKKMGSLRHRPPPFPGIFKTLILLNVCFISQISCVCTGSTAVVVDTATFTGSYTNAQTVDYDGSSHVRMSNVETTLFDIGTDCSAVTTCTMTQSDCSTALTSAMNTYVTFTGSNPYTLTQKSDVTAGYDLTVCIKCVSSDKPAGAT